MSDGFNTEKIFNNSEIEYIDDDFMNNIFCQQHQQGYKEINKEYRETINKHKNEFLEPINYNNNNIIKKKSIEGKIWDKILGEKEDNENHENHEDIKDTFYSFEKTIKNNNLDLFSLVNDSDLNNKSFSTLKLSEFNENISQKAFTIANLSSIHSLMYDDCKNTNISDNQIKMICNNLINSDFKEKEIKIGKIKDDSTSKRPYNKKPKNIKIDLEDKCFPFKLGKGTINIRTKHNININNKKDCEENNLVVKDNNESSLNKSTFYKDLSSDKIGNDISSSNIMEKTDEIQKKELNLNKFQTVKYCNGKNGELKLIKKKRKYKSDLMRKKIKSRFHKTLREIINKNLKDVGSKMFFDNLPQCFIGNISQVLNSKCLNLTYKDIIIIDFGSELNNYRHTSIDVKKYFKNLEVLEYLENNPEISIKSGFEIIKNMKYKDLLNKYFLSSEFENSILKIEEEENETLDYIQSYINKAKNYINFYSDFLSSDKSNNCIGEIDEDDDNDDNDENNENDDENVDNGEIEYIIVNNNKKKEEGKPDNNNKEIKK